MDLDQRLSRLASAAADHVHSGMTLGLGTGSTASAVIRELGRRAADGLRIQGVATSTRTEALARELGIPLVALDDVPRLDLGIDGADEIDPNLNVIKGGGGALLFEKIVALACDDYIVVSASEKRSPALGTRFMLPVEIVAYGWTHTASRLRALGLEPVLRPGPDGAPLVTDNGGYILDCRPGQMHDPAHIAAAIKQVTGVVEHGIFAGIARSAIIVEPDGEIAVETRQ
ncbi:MAG: ribose-5-phosphate isomerase RpiA [Thermomicrobiales bacterium]